MELNNRTIISKFLFILVSAIFAATFVQATFENTLTSIQDCEEENEKISFNTPKEECVECITHKEYSKPESITPKSNTRSVIVEEKEEVKEKKTIKTIEQNVKFDDTICKECEDSFEAPEASTPHSTEKETVITKIKNFVYDCITW